MKIAPEVDRLMWLIADRRDPRAIADFESRFPDLKFELSKRISMVSGLKSAGKKAPIRDIPRFNPRKPTPVRLPGRGAYVAFAFALGAIAFGSYEVATYKIAKAPHLQPISQITPNVTPPEVKPGVPKAPLSANLDGSSSNTTGTPTTLLPNDPMRRLVSLKVENAPLEGAIAMICQQAGLSYQMAPGMPRETVDMSFEAVPAADILATLGAKYGFTAFPQESGSILIIPARDKTGASPTDQPGEPTPR